MIKFLKNNYRKTQQLKYLKYKTIHQQINVCRRTHIPFRLKHCTFNIFLANIDQQTKPHTPSPTRPTFSEPIKKTILRDISPLPVTPASPSPPTPPPLVPSVSHEPITSMNLPLPVTNIQSISYPYETTPGKISKTNLTNRLSEFSSEVKLPEAPLIFQSSSSTAPKDSNDNETLPSNSNKRPHLDENSESVYISSSISEIDEQLSPSKRARRSISSQESIETFR